MTSYADTDNVQALIPEFTITSSSKPNLTEVGEFITQVEGEINGILTAQGYESVPATGTNDVAMLQGYTSRKVAALTWLAAYPTTEPPWKVKDWAEYYRDFLKRLRDGTQQLVDQLPQGDSAPYFAVVRHPTRDDYFTERGDDTDWDE